jgi:hypothetical protein
MTTTKTIPDENSVNALTDRIDALTREYRAGYETLSRAKLDELNREVVALQAERDAAIAAGCSPCPSCGAPPQGMIQKLVVNNQARDGFEVGCRTCLDHRAKGLDLAGARAAWERGPSVAAVLDETGATVKRAVYGWTQPSDGRTIEKTEQGIVSTLADGRQLKHGQKLTVEQRRTLARAARAVSPARPKIDPAPDAG